MTQSIRNPHSWGRSLPGVCPTQGPPSFPPRGASGVTSVEGGVGLPACGCVSRGSLGVGCRQIEKDLLRTMPSNACFANVSSIGVPRLRRVLRALAWLYPEIGYCQGTGMVSTAQEGQ